MALQIVTDSINGYWKPSTSAANRDGEDLIVFVEVENDDRKFATVESHLINIGIKDDQERLMIAADAVSVNNGRAVRIMNKARKSLRILFQVADLPHGKIADVASTFTLTIDTTSETVKTEVNRLFGGM